MRKQHLNRRISPRSCIMPRSSEAIAKWKKTLAEHSHLKLPLGNNIEFDSFMGRHAVNTFNDVIDA